MLTAPALYKARIDGPCSSTACAALGRAIVCAITFAFAAAFASTPLSAKAQTQGCELLVTEHRSGRELLRLPLDTNSAPAPASAPATSQAPKLRLSQGQAQLQIAFTHSVLGSEVQDDYRWQNGQWLLVQERFDGQGYGLPHHAAAGEQLTRDGQTSVLQLMRPVNPLVLRPLPMLNMRLRLNNGYTLVLAQLSTQAIELRALGCGED